MQYRSKRCCLDFLRRIKKRERGKKEETNNLKNISNSPCAMV